MKNLFEPATLEEVRNRIGRLRPNSRRLWGKMTPAQALAHCSAAMECAIGLKLPPRRLAGRLFGRFAKTPILYDGKPMPRNSTTDRNLLVTDQRNFYAEQQRLYALIDRFVAGGPAAVTTHPHSFFGRLTPIEWAAAMYQHLAHHLRQFGV